MWETVGDAAWWPVTVKETADQGWIEANVLKPVGASDERDRQAGRTNMRSEHRCAAATLRMPVGAHMASIRFPYHEVRFTASRIIRFTAASRAKANFERSFGE